MSRSHFKHPKVNYVGYFSNKEDRSKANRKMRHINKQIIKSMKAYEKNIELVYPIDYPDDYDVDMYEYWPEEDLHNSDFKTLREVSDTWGFESDGLPHTISEQTLVYDWSYPYSYKARNAHPQTTLANAKREHNWKTLREYYAK